MSVTVTRTKSPSWITAVGVTVIVICVIFRWSSLLDWKQFGSISEDNNNIDRKDCRTSVSTSSGHNSTTATATATRFSSYGGIVISTTDLNSIPPSSLPGYTGWGRPEWTLTKFFSIVNVSRSAASPSHANATDDGGRGGEEEEEEVLTITIQCDGHVDCRKNDSLFYLRAYGPSVVPGTIARRRHHRRGADRPANDYYDATFILTVPGTYTVEVVLTFSNPPPITDFPLNTWKQPPYEGYLVPGFPLIVDTDDSITHRYKTGQSEPTVIDDCPFEELVETSPTSAMEHNHWKVVGRSNARQYDSQTLTDPVTKVGYEWGRNSIGIYMDYQHIHPPCKILPEEEFSKHLDSKHPLWTCQRKYKKVQIVYIGDSVLRVQKDTMASFLPDGMSKFVELKFLSLHGGYRKNQKLGPANVRGFLQDLDANTPNNDTATAILFNTGLHDIHNLCGSEFATERRDYLDTSSVDSGSFRCINEYKDLLVDFVNMIKSFNRSKLKVFQTTTAAWPKYGNYGISWEHHQQGMPLVSDFAEAFNKVAFDILLPLHHDEYDDGNSNGSYRNSDDDDDDDDDDVISIMDGYWVTYSRPDNREFGDIGKKLSHPGREVLSSMTRRWAMMIMHRLCS